MAGVWNYFFSGQQSAPPVEAVQEQPKRGLRVKRLITTPVKSSALHYPSQIYLEETGLYENRRFMFVEGPAGRFVSLARIGEVVQLKCDYDRSKEILTMTLPTGEVFSDSATDLSEPTIVEIYGRDVPGRFLKNSRWEEILTKHFGRPMRLYRVDDNVASTNTPHNVSIVSTASIESLKEAADIASDFRRFRMLIEVEGCEIAHEEDTWLARTVRIGEVEVVLERECPRCEATTKNPLSGAVDNNTLKDIIKLRGRGARGSVMFGVYGSVTKPGIVRIGDPVEPL